MKHRTDVHIIQATATPPTTPEEYNGLTQNPYIEEEQTTQCPKEKVQKSKQ
jgi:hypothetical protein